MRLADEYVSSSDGNNAMIFGLDYCCSNNSIIMEASLTILKQKLQSAFPLKSTLQSRLNICIHGTEESCRDLLLI